MRTYLNNTDKARSVTYTIPNVKKASATRTHEIRPGARFTFDETAVNGPDIDRQLQTYGMIREV